MNAWSIKIHQGDFNVIAACESTIQQNQTNLLSVNAD